MSTSTLLDTANVVFRSIGERPVTSLTNVQGDRVKDCIKQACTDIETLNSWDWLFEQVNAISWTANVANLGVYRRLYTVSMGELTKGLTELKYLPEIQMDQLPLTPYKGTEDKATYYSVRSGAVLFVNYPTDTQSRGRIWFYVQRPIKVPTIDTDVFQNVPEEYMTLIEKKASYLMCIRYLDDPQSGSYFQQEFEQLVQQYRTFERKAPVRKTSMYRGRR